MDRAAELLPQDIRAALSTLTERERDAAEELRLNAGRRMSLLLPEGERDLGPVIASRTLDTVLETATRASAHTALDSVAGGYVTVRGGLRLGLSGEAVVKDGRIRSLRRLSSIAIRLPREARGCADGIMPALTRGGFRDTLIISPPGAGKTTLLREVVRLLSDGGMRVSLLDERGEAAAVWEGLPMLDVGRRTDVMSGAPKPEAAMLMLRSMSPRLLAMDEVSAPEDALAVETAAGCGVIILATCHASGVEDLKRRPLYRDMLSRGLFRRSVVIRRGADGRREYKVEELQP